MNAFIPCLNVDKPDSGGGFSVSVGIGAKGGDVINISPGVTFTHSDSPITFGITPWPPFIFFGPNFAFWANLFGLGETRIDREKQQIQDVLTGIFRYLKDAYDVPVRDGHALQFSSDGVRAQFARHPELADLFPAGMLGVDRLAQVVFVDDTPSQGQKERIVNQFLANAAINDWSVAATANIWNGMLQAASGDCGADPARWIRNPYIVLRAAEMALAWKYIGAEALTNMATYHAIGDPIAENLVLQWANNPSLVSELTYEDKYPWQGIYQRGEWATPPYRTPFGGTVPLYSRDHFRTLVSGIQVLRPRYPDFQAQPQGGVQSSPPVIPQPSPPPPTPQPTPIPTPQPPPPPPPTQPPVLEIPNQQDYDRACQIMRALVRRQPVSQADLDWMLTGIGSQAMSWAANQPQCAEVPPTQDPLPPEVTQPDCPVYDPGPIDRGGTPFPVPYPTPTPQPFPNPRQRDGVCDPDCQVQIDQIKDRQQECCDKVTTWVIPNIQEIWHWLTDVERRLPGPPPVLQPAPPVGPVPPPELPLPPNEPPGENPPGEPTPPALPPEVIHCLIDLCDHDKLCEKIKECERELECVRIPLCDPQGGPWGGMAECWLDKNTPDATDIWGVMRGRVYPDTFGDAFLAAYKSARSKIIGTSQGVTPAVQSPSPQSDVGRLITPSARAGDMFLDAWKKLRPTPTPYPFSTTTMPPYVFSDPVLPDSSAVQIRQPKLRDGEVDPCSGITQGTLEIG